MARHELLFRIPGVTVFRGLGEAGSSGLLKTGRPSQLVRRSLLSTIALPWRRRMTKAECQHAHAPPRQVPGSVIIVTSIVPRQPRNTGANAATTSENLRYCNPRLCRPAASRRILLDFLHLRSDAIHHHSPIEIDESVWLERRKASFIDGTGVTIVHEYSLAILAKLSLPFLFSPKTAVRNLF